MAHLHCTGSGQVQGPGNDGFLDILRYVLYTLHRDRDRYREPLFSIMLIPVPCSVYEPLLLHEKVTDEPYMSGVICARGQHCL